MNSALSSILFAKRMNASAETISRFQKQEVRVAAIQLARGGKTSFWAADNGDVARFVHIETGDWINHPA